MPSTPRLSQLLNCVAFLNLKLASHSQATPLEPFSVDVGSVIDISRSTKQLARHVGLHRLLFITHVGRMNPQQGGQIELATGQTEVYIDISKDAGRFGPSLLAVLAHELSHKVLFDRDIFRTADRHLEYEILTDVTAIYLGFGKLLLNGYEYRTSRTKIGLLRSETRTHTYRFGYIDRTEVSFLLAFLYHARAYPRHSWTRGLSPNSARLLISCLRQPEMQRHLARAALLVPRASYL